MTKSKQTVVVDSDGEILVATNGHVSGPYEYVKEVKANALIGLPVRLVEPYGELVVCDLSPDNLMGIVAALMSVKPGRSKIVDAPGEVFEWVDRNIEEYGENRG